MADLTVQVVDQQVVVQPFGSDALVPLVAAANQALTDAEAAAAAAAASVGAVKQIVTLYLQPDGGLVEGAWYGSFFLPVGTDFTLLRHWIPKGTGTADARILINDVDVAGPYTVTTTQDSEVTANSGAAGSNVAFQINNITGSPEAIAFQWEGLPS